MQVALMHLSLVSTQQPLLISCSTHSAKLLVVVPEVTVVIVIVDLECNIARNHSGICLRPIKYLSKNIPSPLLLRSSVQKGEGTLELAVLFSSLNCTPKCLTYNYLSWINCGLRTAQTLTVYLWAHILNIWGDLELWTVIWEYVWQ